MTNQDTPDRRMELPPPAAPWHTLFAPLPADVAPRREPVAPAAITGTPGGAAIAGWEQLALELSAGGAACEGRIEYRHASLGGRFETDGTFHGTRWHMASVESAAGAELENTSTPSTPTPADVAALQALVADMLRRAPPPGEP